MKAIGHLLHALLLVFTIHLEAAVPAGKTQQMTSPDQVPEGLEKSDWSSIRAAYEAGRHAFQPVEGQAGVWQARNPGQQWLTKFDGRGFVAEPAGGGWQWGLELESYGFAGHERNISGQPQVRADGQRLTYQWDANVQEWFVNDQRGLEHGFTIKERPLSSPSQNTSTSKLSFLISARGSLRPVITEDAQGVLFQDAAGATMLNYTGLKVWDADGKALASRFEAGGVNRVRLWVDEHTARYPITIDPVAQRTYLKASNTDAGDHFGYSVAISGDRVAIGAPFEASNASGVNAPISGGSGTQEDNSTFETGAVYVFKRTGGGWIQEAYLKPAEHDELDFLNNDYCFGVSIDLDENTIVVGASRSALRNGHSVGGGPGSVYVFECASGVWTQQARIRLSDLGRAESFGHAVSISDSTMIIGAPHSSNWAGAAYIFTRENGTWSQQAYLQASNAESRDRFGWSVAVSNDSVIIGAPDEDSGATGINGLQIDESKTNSGAAYVCRRSGNTWIQEAYLKSSNTDVAFNFGYSVSIDGETAVVGAPYERRLPTQAELNNNWASPTFRPYTDWTEAGAAHVFKRTGGQWNSDAYLTAYDSDREEHFGIAVAVSSDTIVVGAHQERTAIKGGGSYGGGGFSDAGSFTIRYPNDRGSATVFTRSNQVWTQQAYLTSGMGFDGIDMGSWPINDPFSRDNFGHSVAVDAGTVIVGAILEDSNATGVSTTAAAELDDSAADSGAAYVFTGLGPNAVNPKMSITGNQQEIMNGDRIPSRKDHTDFTSSWKNTGVIERTFTIHNKGNSTLNLTGTPTIAFVTRLGPNVDGFSLSKAPSSSIPANTSTTFKVAFKAGSGGNDTSVVIKSDDPNQKIYTFSIKGLGDVSRDSAFVPATPVVTTLGTKNSPGPALTTLTPAFSWKLGYVFSSYGLEIINRVTGEIAYSNEVIGNDEYSGSVGTNLTNFTLPEGVLRPGFQYSWTLRGLNYRGPASRASAPLYFYIPENVPMPTKLTALTPGATTQPGPVITILTPAFLWKPISGTLNHALSIVDLSTGTLAYSNETLGAAGAFNLPAGFLQWGKAYCWTVRARNGAGWGVSSDLFYFQTKSDVVLLTPPALTAPGGAAAPGAVVNSLTPAFTWKPVTGATGYGLYIADVATNQLVYDRDDLTATTILNLPTGILQWGRAYRWNMRTKGSTGWSAFSSRLFFQTRSDFITPGITQITPDVVVGSDALQTVWIVGTGYRTGAQVLLSWPGTTDYIVPAAQTKLESDQRIRILVKTGKLTSEWTAKVRNTDLKISAPFTFQVVAPIPGALAAPVPTPPPGAYTQPIFVSLTPPAAQSVTMRYALNGAAPDSFSTRYESPFLIGDATSVSVTAQAFAEARVPSPVLTARYTFNLPALALPGIRSNLGGAGGSYTYYKITVPAGLSEMTLSTSGGTGDCDWYVRYNRLPMLNEYDASSRNLGTNSESQTLMSPRAGTCYVLVHGAAAYSGVTLTATTKKAAGTTATPTFSLKDGNHAGPIDLRIWSTEPSAEIYYTLDGSEPSLPPLNPGSATQRYIAILPPTLTQPLFGKTQTYTVKARAIVQGKNPSALKTGKFTIYNDIPGLNFENNNQNGILFDEVKFPINTFWASKEDVDFEFYIDMPEDKLDDSKTTLRYPVALTINIGRNAARMKFWLNTNGRASASSSEFSNATLPLKNDDGTLLFVLGSPIQGKGGLVQPGKRYHGLIRVSGVNAPFSLKLDTEVIFQIHYASLLAPNLVGSPIRPSVNDTWLLIHGRGDMASSPKMYNLAQALATSGQTDRVGQVLRLDWSSMADPLGPLSKISLNGGVYIPGVAQRTAQVMNKVLKIPKSQISAVGHSWGSYVAYELGKYQEVKGKLEKLDRLVALDPASTAFGGYEDSKINFADVSNKSWGFVTYYGLYGNESYAGTAKEAFLLNLGNDPRVQLSKHNAPVELFTHLIRTNYDASYFTSTAYQVSRFFTLDRLDNQNISSFWRYNQYPRIPFGQATIFEAEFRGVLDEDGFDQFEPLKLFYMPNPSGTELEWP